MIITIFFSLKYNIWFVELCEHRLFKAHHKIDIHKKKSETVEIEQRIIKLISLTHSLKNSQIWTKISVAHYLVSYNVAIDQFENLLDNHFINVEYLSAQHYQDNEAVWEIAVMIFQYLWKLLKERLAETSYFGIMIDETIDISITQ